MSPTLYPAFDPDISDYVFRFQDGATEQVLVEAPPDAKVSVDGQAYQKHKFTSTVKITPGQSFDVNVHYPPRLVKTYHIRCLPADFPTWTTERLGNPQSEYYVFAPALNITGPPWLHPWLHYMVIADNYGVPLWWYQASDIPTDVKLLPNGNIGWTNLRHGAEERKLDGSPGALWSVANNTKGEIDQHEMLLLPNGNHLFIASVAKERVDLRPLGGPESSTIFDNVVEEVAPNGELIAYWSAYDHLPLSESDSHWLAHWDPYHMNSIEPTATGWIVSLRHCNAVYCIDKATGSIEWKLGGSKGPKSLTFCKDLLGNFGGQHDARVLPDGTLTVHDNGSLLDRAPRAVRYRLDTTAGTATLVEQVSDVDVPSSLLTGSARKLRTGNWVIHWGGSPYLTELAPNGARIFRLTFSNSYFSYRGLPIPFGRVDRAVFRGGMDAQFPR